MMQYSFVKNTTFNGTPLPDIAVLEEDGSYRVLRTFGYEAFRDRLGEPSPCQCELSSATHPRRPEIRHGLRSPARFTPGRPRVQIGEGSRAQTPGSRQEKGICALRRNLGLQARRLG